MTFRPINVNDGSQSSESVAHVLCGYVAVTSLV